MLETNTTLLSSFQKYFLRPGVQLGVFSYLSEADLGVPAHQIDVDHSCHQESSGHHKPLMQCPYLVGKSKADPTNKMLICFHQ